MYPGPGKIGLGAPSIGIGAAFGAFSGDARIGALILQQAAASEGTQLPLGLWAGGVGLGGGVLGVGFGGWGGGGGAGGALGGLTAEGRLRPAPKMF